MKLLAVTLALCLSGCALTQRPPKDLQDKLAIAIARDTSVRACVELRKAIKADEAEKLAASLAALRAVIDSAPQEKIVEAIGLIDPAIAPFSNTIAGVAVLAVESFTPEARASVLAQIIRATIVGCGVGIEVA